MPDTEPGPPLAELLHHLGRLPAELGDEPRVGEPGKEVGKIHVDAVVFDLLLALGGGWLPGPGLRVFRGGPTERNRLRLVLIAAWLFHHPWFKQGKRFAEPCRGFLAQGLVPFAAVVDADRVITEPERREELARLALAALGLRPADETEAQARDRLSGLDSAEKERLLAATRERLRREREAEIARRKKEEEEAAARYGRE